MMENPFNEGEEWKNFASKNKSKPKKKISIFKNLYNSILGNVAVTELSGKKIRIELEESIYIDFAMIIEDKDVTHLHAILEDYMYKTSGSKDEAENDGYEAD